MDSGIRRNDGQERTPSPPIKSIPDPDKGQVPAETIFDGYRGIAGLPDRSILCAYVRTRAASR